MAKATKNIELKIGAVILLSLTLLVGFVFLLGDFSFQERAILYVDYPNTGQVNVGAPVRITGVKIGKVKEIQLWAGRREAKSKRRVMVRMKLRVFKKHLHQIHKDAKFFIATEGLLGQKYIEIAPGSMEKPVAEPGEVFIGVAPMKIEDFAASADSILKELNSALKDNRKRIEDMLDHVDMLTKDADNILKENRVGIKKIVDNTGDAMVNAKKITEHVKNITRQYQKINDIVDNFQNVSRQLLGVGKVMAQARQGMQDLSDMIKALKAPIHEGSQKTLAILDKVKAIVSRLNSGDNSLSMLMKDKQLYWDLVELIKDVKKHPWKLIIKQ